MTDDLIHRLSAEAAPVAPGRVAARLALGLAVGVAVSAVVMMLGFGLRPDYPQALATRMFWTKLAYVVAIAAVGLWAVDRLARPAGRGGRRLAWVAGLAVIVAGLAALRMASMPVEGRHDFLMGSSSDVCPWRIALLSLPPMAGLMIAVRELAPTRLRLAGLAVGLAAGGAGAAVYALHCPEQGMAFLAVWYSLGIAISGAVGWLAGPIALRWR